MRLKIFRKLLAACALACVPIITAAADDPVSIPVSRAQALGASFVELRAARSALLDGLPARVSVPAADLHAVSAPVTALVARVLVAEGDRVSRGQPLARLASAELATARRALLQADAQLKLAEVNLARERQLLDEGIIASSRFAATQAHARETRAALAEARQLLALAGVAPATIEAMRRGAPFEPVVVVASPVDGVVTARQVVPGQRVEPLAALFQVAQGGRRTLLIRVPRDRVPAVAPGAAVLLGSKVLGAVEAIGASVDPSSQTVLVRARLDALADGPRIGEVLEVGVRLPVGASERAFMIPPGALVRSGAATFVLAAVAGQVRAVPVRLLHGGVAHSLVTGDALESGMQVAVTGTAALKAVLLAGGAQ